MRHLLVGCVILHHPISRGKPVYAALQASTEGTGHGSREGQGRFEERQEEGPEERQGEACREEDEEGRAGTNAGRMTLVQPRCSASIRRNAVAMSGRIPSGTA